MKTLRNLFIFFSVVAFTGCRNIDSNTAVTVNNYGGTVNTSAGNGPRELTAPKDYGRAFSGNDAAITPPLGGF